MTWEQAKDEIKAGIPCTRFLEKSRSGESNKYCCPLCGSGTRRGGSGALHYYASTNTWHCFSCGKSGDVLSLYAATNNTDFTGALKALCAEQGITIDPPQTAGQPRRKPIEGKQMPAEHSKPQTDTDTTPATNGPQSGTAANYNVYYNYCAAHLTIAEGAQEYLTRRGISMETAFSLGLGYDDAADPASAPGAMGKEYKPHPCPRIIIPISRAYYVARSIDPDTPKGLRAMGPKGSTPAIFNLEAVKKPGTVAICEGVFDALSFREAGLQAIALDSTANRGKFLAYLEAHTPPAGLTLALALDTDGPGQAAQQEIITACARLSIPFVVWKNKAGKDPNEFLCADRAGFMDAVREIEAQTAARPDALERYFSNFMAGDIDAYKGAIPTGFPLLDKLSGGFHPGLYVLGAISSLGKTTFALQIADHIATRGKDVLFFSLEQSKFELASKILARRTAETDLATAVNSLSIRRGYLPGNVLAAKADFLEDGAGDCLSVIEGNFNLTPARILGYLSAYRAKNPDSCPLVILDYLQIITPDNQTRTTKEAIDSTVTALKRISRDLSLPVFVISSLNRENYTNPIDFTAFKESGAIEYSADVVWGLQLSCMSTPDWARKGITAQREAVKEAKAKTPREISLVCLKNRFGPSSYTVDFAYYPAFDLFREGDSPADDAPKMPPVAKRVQRGRNQ